MNRIPFNLRKFVFRWSILSICGFVISGCATNRQNRWLATGAGFATGVAVGTASAPGDERKELHAVYWGALVGLGAALISQEVFSDAKEIERLTLENQKQSLQLDVIQNATTVLQREGKGYFKSPTGEELLPNGKAKWKLYQIDKWVKDGPTRLIHQDRMVEITPLSEGSK